MVVSRMDSRSGDPLRDCNLFWIHRNDQTDWIFARLWKLGQTFNDKYGFELSPNIGAAQLTRYMPGQKYDWHMDLGANDSSLRKISLVLSLSSNEDIQGGGIEIFYGDVVDNRIRADMGDVVAFPSFVMHRASMVQSGTRWSLVVWLTGPRPLR
jgi:PKHD-type hydroxylase